MYKKTFVCKECGCTFEVVSDKTIRANYAYCFNDHYRTCVICGKQFVVPRNKLSSKAAPTCSIECLNKAKGLLAIESAKMHPKYECICTCCGKLFKSSSPNARLCNDDHYITCSVCGKSFLATREQALQGTQTCSSQCRYRLTFQTYHNNYDIDKNPEAHEALQQKIKTTMLERYGVSNSFSKEGREVFNIKQKMIDSIGVDHPMKSAKILEQRTATNVEKYGSACPATSDILASKSRETLLNRYGVDNYAKSAQFLKQVITEPEKASKCKEFRDDPAAFVSKYFPNSKPTLAELSEMCGIRDSSIGYILDQVGHPDIVAYTYSRMEDEIYRFLLQELGSNMIIERNTFKVILPYELDIYLPEYDFAIECDPTITHNSTIPGWSENDEPKDINYHKMKTDLCEEKGIFLFHIFGYDWSHHKDVIESMLRNVINTTPNKIYARTTELREVSDHDAMQFLNDNHRQGGAHSSIRLGLYYEEKLISLMTFSKMRNTIGTGKANLDNCFELVRFCNKINTNVVGGASKLFKYFVDNYNPEEIRSFSDRAHTRGTLYSKLGFNFDHTSDPGYMWVDLKTDRGYARNNAQKNNIKSFLKDDTIDLNKSEVQIMKEHDFVQVFDSGVKLWIWRK